jgi:hypothetical protein
VALNLFVAAYCLVVIVLAQPHGTPAGALVRVISAWRTAAERLAVASLPERVAGPR